MKTSKIMKRVISAFAWKMMIPDMGKALTGMRKGESDSSGAARWQGE
ncbi:hypothetical protein V8G57_02270 [Collimonas sp. H4R21]|jgi:hypothetical protein|uniref:Uncharacterized protein n=1 Tax=Collimonas rhizosphaerae TaxID=3126357 RepID=A0ABU9PQC9_9BURK|nr:hypothetical protein [Collimonas sp. OK412]